MAIYEKILYLDLNTWKPQYLHRGEPFVIQWNLDCTKPLYNEVLDITNDLLQPGQSYSKIHGIEQNLDQKHPTRKK